MFKLAAIFDYMVDQTFGPEKYWGGGYYTVHVTSLHMYM